MGIRFTGLLAASVMLAGAFIKMYGLSPYFNDGAWPRVFWLVLDSMPARRRLLRWLWRVRHRRGNGRYHTSRTVVKWFAGREMALAMGMQLATARLGASVAFFFSAPLAECGPRMES